MRSLAAVLMILAACGGKPAPTPTTPRPSPAQPPGGDKTKPGGDAPTGEAMGKAGDGGDAAADPAVCASRTDMFGPFALDEAQARRRYGANAKRFADAPTTKDRAIEVCGIPASRQWLRGTSCADGSPAKQNGRSGSVGPGGRCGAIIDLYSVTCPEGDYDVYIDIYMCGPGESMR